MSVDNKPQVSIPALSRLRIPVPWGQRVEIPGVSDTRLSDGTKMLLALSRTRKHCYLGTVPAAEKARRRRRNRAARHARRVHRG